MQARVIQGRFHGSVPRIASVGAVQMRPTGNAQPVPANFIPRSAGGRPLPDGVRQKMEGFFKASFSDVRVHVGPEAPSIGALAFTLGSNLYFAPGQYNPDTPHGQQLLGHELTHVIQQRAGRVRNPFGNGIAIVQDPALEMEADRMSTLAMANFNVKAPIQAKSMGGTLSLGRMGGAPMHMAAQLGQHPIAQRPHSVTEGTPRAPLALSHRADAVQMVKMTRQKGPDGTSNYNFYKKKNRQFAERAGKHWYFRDNANHAEGGWWVKSTKKGKHGTFNRVVPPKLGRGGIRAGRMDVRLGSGASYSDTARRLKVLKTTRMFQITSNSHTGGREYAQNMLIATIAELGLGNGTNSATVYAANFGAPVINGGYNWCHLIGHGGGGSDNADNIVAASTHCNSEQLLIERILYDFKNSSIFIMVKAFGYKQAQHLASKIQYKVFVVQNGLNFEIYKRDIDAFRSSAPDVTELAKVKQDIYNELERFDLQ